MIFKKTYKNSDYSIELTTNNKQISTIVDNFLDFSQVKRNTAKFKAKISIDLADSNIKESLFFPKGISKDSNWSGTLESRVAEVEVDAKRNCSKATIFNYHDSYKEHLLHLTFFKPLKIIFVKFGLYCIHAAAIKKNDTCVLICGPQNTGKSTISFLFYKNGYDMLCDDDCFIKASKNDCLIYPFPTKMGIKNQSLKKNKIIKSNIIKNYLYGNKQRVSLKDIHETNIIKYKQRIILFPIYQENHNLKISKLTNKEAIKRLFNENPNLNGEKKTAKNMSKVIATYTALVKNAVCLKIIYCNNNVNDIPAAIDKLS